MLWRLVLANGLALAGIGWLAVGGSQLDGKPLVSEALATEFGALEERAAHSRDAGSVTSLAGAYLQRDQPGLATAVIERASAEVRQRPDVAQLHARALFGRGQAREALAMMQSVTESCDPEASQGGGVSSSPARSRRSTDVSPRQRCSPWLVAKATRQLAFLEEVVAAGIEDPQADPAATMAAYERSNREVRLVAMR